MNKSITQATQNDKQIPKSIKRFLTRFHIYSALKAANAYKRKGTPNFAKDTVYRFMKMVQINWMRFYNPCIQNLIISFYTVDQPQLHILIQYEYQTAPIPPDQNNPDYPARTCLLYVLQSLLPTQPENYILQLIWKEMQ